MAVLTWMGVPGSPEQWATCGFDIADGRFVVDGVVFEVGTEPAWGFDSLDGDASRLGVPTHVKPKSTATSAHPNLVDRIDHVVYAVPNLDAATSAVEDIVGLELRRRFHPRGRGGPEMAFYRAGPSVIEVVQGPPEPGLWGIAFLCMDLDATVEAARAAGAPIGDPKPAVQGGRIASIWKEHVGWGVAIMEPRRAS
jgi:catechol 2,3-dioxygenase-like lactoylglutathione lyase family enzyme